MIPLCKPYLTIEAENVLKSCLSSGWLGYGPACLELEKRFIAAHGGWALSTSSCTSALHIAANLIPHSPQDEIIIPSMTFISTAMAFLYAGFSIRLADVDQKTLLLATDSVEKRLTDRTRAVVAVHLYGQKAETVELKRLCDKHGLILIEDCAHRLDLLDGSPPIGDYACYSFNAVKEAPAGEGGLLWGRDHDFNTCARAISNLGMHVDTLQRTSSINHGDYCFGSEHGLKLRLNDLSAALANAALSDLGDTRKKRAEIFNYYDSKLAVLSTYIQPLNRNSNDSFLMYIIRLRGLDRKRLRADMAVDGVATSIHYPSLTSHPLLNTSGQCPNADKASGEILTLPCYPGLSPKQQEAVVLSLKKAIHNQT